MAGPYWCGHADCTPVSEGGNLPNDQKREDLLKRVEDACGVQGPFPTNYRSSTRIGPESNPVIVPCSRGHDNWFDCPAK